METIVMIIILLILLIIVAISIIVRFSQPETKSEAVNTKKDKSIDIKKINISWLKPSPYWILLTLLLLGCYLVAGSDIISAFIAAVLWTIIVIVIYKLLSGLGKGIDDGVIKKIDPETKDLIGTGLVGGIAFFFLYVLVWIVWRLPDWVG